VQHRSAPGVLPGLAAGVVPRVGYGLKIDSNRRRPLSFFTGVYKPGTVESASRRAGRVVSCLSQNLMMQSTAHGITIPKSYSCIVC